MIRYMRGDLFKAETEALVNTVNCVGFMGRGIAAQFRRAYPTNFTVYKSVCDRGEMVPGRVLVVDLGQLVMPRCVINFPTKRHWRAKSRLEDIEAGLLSLRDELLAHEIRSVAIPPLGCGLGGLSWSEVRPRIERALADLDGVDVWLYEPAGAPAADVMARSPEPPKMTPGRAVLIGLIERYLAGFMDPFISLLEVHKLMYFAQVAGQELRLNFKKAPYGPYAENLRHVLSHVEGHLLEGYADGGDRPDKQLQLLPGAINDARALLASDTATKNRFDRVANLVEGYESEFGMELLATVHWVVTQESADDLETVVDRVHRWNSRKRQFKRRHIEIALYSLREQGWLGS